MKLIETYEDISGNEIQVLQCSCGRTHHVQSGGDIAGCPCEWETEGC